MQLAQELEARARRNTSLELYNMYCETPPADQVLDLLQQLQENADVVDLSNYSPVCIANIFKKFLRELPDPVIPVRLYDQFIEAASKFLPI